MVSPVRDTSTGLRREGGSVPPTAPVQTRTSSNEGLRESLRGMSYDEQRQALSPSTGALQLKPDRDAQPIVNPRPDPDQDRRFDAQRRIHVDLDRLDGLVNELSARVGELRGQEEVAEFPAFAGQVSDFDAGAMAFHGHVEQIRSAEPETADAAEQLLAGLAEPFAAFARTATPYAYAAKGAGEPGIARGIIQIAATAHQRAGGLRAEGLKRSGDEVESHSHDTLGGRTGMVDAGQTTVGGVGGGIVGAVDLGKTVGSGADKMGVVTHAIGVGGMAAIGYATGAVGALFGAIGMALGIRAFLRGKAKEKELAGLIPTLDSGRAREIAEYAQAQKKKKKVRGKLTAIAGATAVGAGLLGMIAVSVTTLGLAAVIVGIGAALLGLGIGIYKWYRSSSKRRQERDQLAQGIMEAVSGGDTSSLGDIDAGILDMARRANETGGKKDFNALSNALKAVAQSRRAQAADAALDLLVQGGPADRFDAELVVEALGLKSDELRGYVTEGKPNTARDRIMRKMKSW